MVELVSDMCMENYPILMFPLFFFNFREKLNCKCTIWRITKNEDIKVSIIQEKKTKWEYWRSGKKCDRSWKQVKNNQWMIKEAE